MSFIGEEFRAFRLFYFSYVMKWPIIDCRDFGGGSIGPM